MTTFDRAKPWLGHSLAFRLYREQFTELNSQYWGGAPSEVLSRRFLTAHEATDSFDAALGVTSDRWSRVGVTVGEYEQKFKSHRRWSTLLTLTLLTSCFEHFVSTIGRSATVSDPLLVPGFPKRVDGAMLLRHGHALPIETVGLTKGEWPQRLSTFRSLFGDVPRELREAESELEQMRKMRNRVAHQFGMVDVDLVPAKAFRPETLSETRLQKWMGVVDTAARSIDATLCANFVGDFETIELYLRWNADPDAVQRKSGITVAARYRHSTKAFQKFLGGFVGRTLGESYFKELHRFYAAL